MALRAVHVRFERDRLCVALNDGRTISAPLDRFPRLRDATPAQRANWSLIANGAGVHWPDVDEDLSAEGMLAC